MGDIEYVLDLLGIEFSDKMSNIKNKYLKKSCSGSLNKEEYNSYIKDLKSTIQLYSDKTNDVYNALLPSIISNQTYLKVNTDKILDCHVEVFGIINI